MMPFEKQLTELPRLCARRAYPRSGADWLQWTSVAGVGRYLWLVAHRLR